MRNTSQGLPIFNILNIYTEIKGATIIGKIIMANFIKCILDPKYNSVAIVFKKLRNRSAILAITLKVAEKLNKLANCFSRNHNIIFK